MKRLLLIVLFFASALSAYAIQDENHYMGLFFKKHTAQNERALMILTHGVLEHSGRYLSFIEHLNRQGVTVYRYDLRGHGQSYGIRGHISKFDSYVDDLNLMLEKIEKENPDLPVILYGHSMGGLITYRFLSKKEAAHKVHAVILSSPALKLPMGKAEKLKLFAAPIARKIVPKMMSGEGIDSSKLSDLNIAPLLENDPLMLGDFTISLGHELVKASVEIEEEGMKPLKDLPVLLIQGNDDEVVDSKGVLKLAPSFTTSQNIVEIDSARHEPLSSSSEILSQYLRAVDDFLQRSLN